jgi:hypothetical protein
MHAGHLDTRPMHLHHLQCMHMQSEL